MGKKSICIVCFLYTGYFVYVSTSCKEYDSKVILSKETIKKGRNKLSKNLFSIAVVSQCVSQDAFFFSILGRPPTRVGFFICILLTLVQLMSQSHIVSVTPTPTGRPQTGHAPITRWVHSKPQSQERDSHPFQLQKKGEIFNL